MVVVTVSAAGRSSSLKGLPTTVEITNKGADAVTVGDVKAAVAAKFPKVLGLSIAETGAHLTPLLCKAHAWYYPPPDLCTFWRGVLRV